MFDRLVGACMAVLLASVAIYCATQVIQSIWPVLVIIIALAWIAIIVIRIWLTRRF